MDAPEYPSIHLRALTQARMKDGKTATVWVASTQHNGTHYQLNGPIRSNPLPNAPWVNDPDGARQAFTTRFARRIITG
jgi:hypothetical protein